MGGITSALKNEQNTQHVSTETVYRTMRTMQSSYVLAEAKTHHLIIISAPEKVRIFTSKMPMTLPNPIFDHL